MKVRDLIIFVAGCAVGGIGASLYLKDVYRRYAQEEIDSVIDRERHKRETEACSYGRAVEDSTEDEERIEHAKEAAKNAANKSSITEYANVVKKEGYKDYSEYSKPEPLEEKEGNANPISYILPSEFGDEDAYEQIELTYYADGILADEEGDLVQDIDLTVGNEFDEHFGEYDDAMVYIKNDVMKAYYMIYMSDDCYRDIFEA